MAGGRTGGLGRCIHPQSRGLLEATLGEGRRFAAADIILLHVNGLAAFAGAYLLIEPVRSAANAPLAAGLALFHGILSYVTLSRQREEALHFLALAFTLLTIAIGLQFEGAWMTSAWAAEGAVVIWLGLRERREWLRIGGLLLFAVATAAIDRAAVLGSTGRPDPSIQPSGHLRHVRHRADLSADVRAPRLGKPATRSTETGIGLVTAKLLLLALAASEIVAYWTLHPPPPFEPASQVVAACLIVGAVTMWLGLSGVRNG